MKQAMISVDVLTGIFELGVELHRPEDFLGNIERLLSRARAAGTTVVHVRHLGREGSPFAPGAPGRAIHPRAAPTAGEPVIEKSHPDSFQGTTLEALLRDRDIGEVVVCGFASEACVDTIVRSAYAKGFSVVLAADAHTTTENPVLPAERIVAHHNFVLRRFARVEPAAAIELRGEPSVG